MFQTSVVTAGNTNSEPFVEWSPEWPKRMQGATNILVVVHRQVGIRWEGMRNFKPSYSNHGFICQRKAQDTEPVTTASQTQGDDLYSFMY